MRPPICEICDVKFVDDDLNQQGHGGLVEFKPSAEDKEVIAQECKSRVGLVTLPTWAGFANCTSRRRGQFATCPMRQAMVSLRKKFSTEEES
jgi:hypothetical protein